MTREILALCRAMGADEEQELLLAPMVEAVVPALRGRLKAGVTEEECGSAFRLAAAMMAMEGLDRTRGGQVASFTAGDLSIRTGGGGESGLSAQAERLLAPWLRETGFAFRGVRG